MIEGDSGNPADTMAERMKLSLPYYVANGLTFLLGSVARLYTFGGFPIRS